MKASQFILFILAITLIGFNSGCQPMADSQYAGSSAMQIKGDMTTEEKAIAELKEKLSGFSSELGGLDKKLREQDLDSPAAMSKKAELDEQLMQLRKEAWSARNTVISGDIQEGAAQIELLLGQLDAFMKEADSLGKL